MNYYQPTRKVHKIKYHNDDDEEYIRKDRKKYKNLRKHKEKEDEPETYVE